MIFGTENKWALDTIHYPRNLSDKLGIVNVNSICVEIHHARRQQRFALPQTDQPLNFLSVRWTLISSQCIQRTTYFRAPRSSDGTLCGLIGTTQMNNWQLKVWTLQYCCNALCLSNIRRHDLICGLHYS